MLHDSKRIKLCGITTMEAVHAVNQHDIGFAGFIAAPLSPRFVTPAIYHDMACRITSTIGRVLVTLDATDEMMDAYISMCRPDFLQLHGTESPERCHFLTAHYGIPIIKAIGVRTKHDIAHARMFTDAASMILFDTRTAEGATGGTGKCFDWALLAEHSPALPWFLSGGIDNTNIAAALGTYAPYIDISSGVESQKGVKDIAKIAKLMDSVRQFQQEEQ